MTQNQNYNLSNALLVPLILSLAMWIVYKLDGAYDLDLFVYGLYPRSPLGLRGVLTSPLLHDTRSYFHVFENTVALLFFGTLLYYFYRQIATKVLVVSWLMTGLLVWSIAKPVFHIGMSGVIYALAFFLITSSIIRKNRQLTGLNFLIIFLYGSIFWGLFPLMPRVSWESHLFGAISGVALGLYYRKFVPHHIEVKPPIQDDPNDDAEDAWWKTGVINENKPQQETTIHYEYKPTNKPPDPDEKQ